MLSILLSILKRITSSIGFFFVDFFDKETTGRFDDRKGLVELMGNTGGHLPQGCHFAGLDQLLLGFQSFGNITGGHQKYFFARILGRRNSDIDKKGHIALV